MGIVLSNSPTGMLLFGILLTFLPYFLVAFDVLFIFCLFYSPLYYSEFFTYLSPQLNCKCQKTEIISYSFFHTHSCIVLCILAKD